MEQKQAKTILIETLTSMLPEEDQAVIPILEESVGKLEEKIREEVTADLRAAFNEERDGALVESAELIAEAEDRMQAFIQDQYDDALHIMKQRESEWEQFTESQYAECLALMEERDAEWEQFVESQYEEAAGLVNSTKTEMLEGFTEAKEMLNNQRKEFERRLVEANRSKADEILRIRKEGSQLANEIRNENVESLKRERMKLAEQMDQFLSESTSQIHEMVREELKASDPSRGEDITDTIRSVISESVDGSASKAKLERLERENSDLRRKLQIAESRGTKLGNELTKVREDKALLESKAVGPRIPGRHRTLADMKDTKQEAPSKLGKGMLVETAAPQATPAAAAKPDPTKDPIVREALPAKKTLTEAQYAKASEQTVISEGLTIADMQYLMGD